MRVLQLIDSLEPGGAERMAVSLANELVNCVDKSFLCATRKEGLLLQTIDKDVVYFFLNKKKKVDVSAFLRLKKHVEENAITIIHAHSSSYFYASLLKRMLPELTLIWHDHNGNRLQTSSKQTFILKRSSRYFDCIIAVNRDLKTWAETHLETRPIIHLNNFVSNAKISEETLELSGAAGKRIICLANIRLEKNHKLLIDAFKIVKKQDVDATLHLIGALNNDTVVLPLMAQIKEQKIDGVHFLGKQLDVASLLRQANIGVLSSVFEGLPVSLLEYGMSGLPVVCTDVGDCKVVLQGRGRLVPSGDSLQLAKELLFYLNNTQEAHKDAYALKQHVINEYSFKSIAEQLLSLYKHNKN